MPLEPPVDPGELRDWLRSLKKASGLSAKQIAIAVGEDYRNVTRWMSPTEPTIPAGDTMLRLLSCLGVTLEPPPPGTVMATNAQLVELRDLIAERTREWNTLAERDRPARHPDDDFLLTKNQWRELSQDDALGRLGELEAKVAELPTAADLRSAVEILLAAIHPRATVGTGEGLPGSLETEAV